jgi:hypothetical protein
VLGIAVLSSIFASYGGYRTGQQFVDGMAAAQMVGAVALMVAALLALAIPARMPILSVDPAITLSDAPVSVAGVSALG